MINFIKTFRKNEDGAVTVDWVVLTAAVVGLGIAAVATVSGGINTATNTLVNDLSSDMSTATATN
ncbi:Flp family type IVb pilin [Thalassovita aquimarina]|uniref:Pilus assembly protein n=1 Tax=Thalassovita aquimarina TaxID=2785917 RepID=A0ABS5HVT3_9RHOB|nr:pilus assembly protein [Thalassovita aquimarina]MBR9653030.1 pilus assembly protein [Thalassovita aquimarina]